MSCFIITDAEKARIDAIFARVTADTATYGGIGSFDPTWVMVVTWVNMYPALSYDPAVDTVIHSISILSKQKICYNRIRMVNSINNIKHINNIDHFTPIMNILNM